MYITHLAALSSLALSSAYNVHTQPPSAYNVYTQPPSLALCSAYNVYQLPLQAPETLRFYDTDTHRNTSIGSRSLALCTCTWKGVWGLRRCGWE